MRDDNFKIREDLSFDTPFIIRSLIRWAFASLCVAIICGVLAFVGADRIKKNVYTASAIVTVAVKTNDTSYLSSYNFNAAVTRNVNMWNSSVLWATMKDDNPGVAFDGSLKATAIEGSGLVRLTATAYSARDAFQILSAATQSYRKIYQNFDIYYRNVMITSINENTIQVATVSIWKYGALGFAMGLMICLGLVGIWTLITDILHNETQAKNLLDAPVFGTLPRIPNRGKKRSMLIATQELPISYLESVDMLASKVESSMQHTEKKVLMVTSAFENDGKTSVASNLALTLAKRGRQVLLIDLDLRHPSLYRIFEKEKDEEVHLFHVIKRRAPLKKYAEKSEYSDNLEILWQFRSVKDSDGFIENSVLAKQFSSAKKYYDYIIIDTPPIGLVRDTELIAQMADCSLLLLRQDSAHAAMVNDFIDLLGDNNCPCIGVVMNKCRSVRRILSSNGFRGRKYSHYRRGGNRA